MPIVHDFTADALRFEVELKLRPAFHPASGRGMETEIPMNQGTALQLGTTLFLAVDSRES